MEYDDSKFDESSTPCSIKNREKLADICYLLGIESPEWLEEEMVNKSKSPLETSWTPLWGIPECIDTWDSLAKAMYNSLFCWIVKWTNLTILPPYMIKGEHVGDHVKSIGLLDIFGFEWFKENFFE